MYVYARTSGSIRTPAGPVNVLAGSVWWADCDEVRAHPEMFSVTPALVNGTREAPVEQMTAAPGEKRAVRRAR